MGKIAGIRKFCLFRIALWTCPSAYCDALQTKIGTYRQLSAPFSNTPIITQPMPAPKTYYQLHIGVREEDYDLAYGILSDYPILGVVEGYDQLTITFGPGSDIADLQRNILAACASADIDVTNASTETVQEQNWNEAWEQMIEPVMVSDRIAIVPEWKKDEVASEIRIIVNPKMSFGTGHHATTRLMLRFLENNVRPGAFWIDVGTGTGVLAIAAIKLGAHSVDALDNDEWSLENAPENFRLNGVEPHIALRQADIRQPYYPIATGLQPTCTASRSNRLYLCLKMRLRSATAI